MLESDQCCFHNACSERELGEHTHVQQCIRNEQTVKLVLEHRLNAATPASRTAFYRVFSFVLLQFKIFLSPSRFLNALLCRDFRSDISHEILLPLLNFISIIYLHPFIIIWLFSLIFIDLCFRLISF